MRDSGFRSSGMAQVLFVTFPEGLGGPQRWMDDLLRAPGVDRQHKLEVWRPSGNFRGIAGKFRLLAEVRRRLGGRRQDLVYLALDLDFAAQLTFLLRIMGCRSIVVHSHNCGFCPDRPMLRKLYQHIVRQAWRKAAVSEQAARAMFGADESECVIYPVFIDFRHLAQSADSAGFAQHQHDGYRFGFVGRLAPQKQPLFAIRAFAGLLARHPGARMVMVGDGPMRDECRRLVDDLDIGESIDLVGATERVGEIYRNRLDCLLVPSSYEGQCRVAAEAQFFGCQVLCSDVLPEQAFLDPEAAIRLPADDIRAWVEAMTEAVEGGLRGRNWTIEEAENHPFLGRAAGVKSLLDLVS